MNPNYVVSFKLASQLEKLGFPQETDFAWYTVGGMPQILERADWFTPMGSPDYKLVCAAPHVGELGQMLPWQIILNERDEVYLSMSKDEDDYRLLYEGLDERGTEFCWENIIENTEANARAAMLIWLAKKKFIKPNLLWITLK